MNIKLNINLNSCAYNADGQLVEVLSKEQAEKIIEYRKKRLDRVEQMIANHPFSHPTRLAKNKEK